MTPTPSQAGKVGDFMSSVDANGGGGDKQANKVYVWGRQA